MEEIKRLLETIIKQNDIIIEQNLFLAKRLRDTYLFMRSGENGYHIAKDKCNNDLDKIKKSINNMQNERNQKDEEEIHRYYKRDENIWK